MWMDHSTSIAMRVLSSTCPSMSLLQTEVCSSWDLQLRSLPECIHLCSARTETGACWWPTCDWSSWEALYTACTCLLAAAVKMSTVPQLLVYSNLEVCLHFPFSHWGLQLQRSWAELLQIQCKHQPQCWVLKPSHEGHSAQNVTIIYYVQLIF